MRLLVIEDSELDYEMLVATLAMQGVPARAERVETAASSPITPETMMNGGGDGSVRTTCSAWPLENAGR